MLFDSWQAISLTHIYRHLQAAASSCGAGMSSHVLLDAEEAVQGANMVFMHPLGSYNFGGGEELGRYHAKICKWFRNAVWFVAERVRAT